VSAGAWLLLAFGAWLFVKYHRDFPDVQYVDLLWPGRWAQYRINQGNHYIAQSEILLQRGEYALALHKLRVGLGKAPANAHGRRLLAQIYLAYRRPDLAREVLLEGLPYLADDRMYLQTTLAFLLEFQEDAKLLEVTNRLLTAPAGSATRPVIATFAATAEFYRGSYDAAEELLECHHLHETADGAVLLARIAWEQGFPELALFRLKQHLAHHPRDDGARALLAGYYQSLGRISKWESTLVERVTGDPLAPAPRVAYLQLHHRRGDESRLEHETTIFLQQFAQDPSALLLLATFAANAGRPALAGRVQQALAPYPENADSAALLVAEAHLVAGEYQTALDLIAGSTREYPEWVGQFVPAVSGLHVVALSGLGRLDEARLCLDHLLARQNLRAESLVAVAGRLSALGARDLALSALGRAVEIDPLNQAALASLIRLELDTGAVVRLPAYLGQFLRTRQPSREILSQARATLGSDRHLLLPGQADLLASSQTALARHPP
jgi:tetratricopeptide (TPR) repeat protein